MKSYTLRFREQDKDMFEAIRNGRKIIETRAASPKYQGIRAGDQLILVCGKEKFEKNVGRVDHFKTIEDLFNKIELSKVMPNVSSVADATKAYYAYPGYKEKINQYGLLAFYLK